MDQNSDNNVGFTSQPLPVIDSVIPTSNLEQVVVATPTPTPNIITAEYREKVYKELAQAMLDGLDKGTITIEQSDEISHFVLDHLDNVGTIADLIVFVKELASKWPVYQSVLLRLQDESQKDEKIKGVQENINQITNQ